MHLGGEEADQYLKQRRRDRSCRMVEIVRGWTEIASWRTLKHDAWDRSCGSDLEEESIAYRRGPSLSVLV